MAGPFSSGPCFMFLGLATSTQFTSQGVQQVSSPAFLGTGEVGPRLAHHYEKEPVMNDVAGSKLPFDSLMMGELAMISYVLTIWEEPIIQRLERKINLANAVLGSDAPLDRGSLMIAEGLFFEFWLLYGHRNKPIMLASGMPAGRHYYCTEPDEVATLPGRRSNRKEVSMTAHGKPLYNQGIPTGAFQLWDMDMSAVANLIL